MNQAQEEDSSCSNSTPFNSSDDPNPNPCPICLGPVNSDAYLDRCFHRYCFECILRWARVVSRRVRCGDSSSVQCPLCKTVNFSIIYGKYLQMSRWLQSWLTREIQALTQEEDVDIIMHHILGVIESFSRRCCSDEKRGPRQEPEVKEAEFKATVADAARPFLMARTERFVYELELFLASGLTIEAYDEAYKKKLGWQSLKETSERSEHKAEGTDHVRTGPYSYLFADSSDEAD